MLFCQLSQCQTQGLAYTEHSNTSLWLLWLWWIFVRWVKGLTLPANCSVCPPQTLWAFCFLALDDFPLGSLGFTFAITQDINWRRQWHPTLVLLPGKSHERRSLVGCSPRGRWESDTTEWFYFDFSLLCIGEGNGNPLQCSCLENPRDGEAGWAAVYEVAQSRARLKWLSSSSSSKSNSPGIWKDSSEATSGREVSK